MSMSKRPARLRAGSMAAGLLVAATNLQTADEVIAASMYL
jgi:hypothetical protein